MEFKFDPKNSEQNKTKHGIDFIEAQPCGMIPMF
jgi:uncharacterized DUF497 family protein